MATRTLTIGALVLVTFLVILALLAVFLLAPPVRRPVPPTPPKYWDAPTGLTGLHPPIPLAQMQDV